MTTIFETGGVTLIDRNLRKWFDENWTHRLLAYGLVVVTLSLIVQVVAAVLIGRL